MTEVAPTLPGRPRGLLLAWAVALAVVSVAGVQLARTYGDRRSGHDQFQMYSSDFLVGAAVYSDLFVDQYSLKGFQFSAATFAVPDLLVYLPVRAIAGSAVAAQLPWQACLFALFVLAAWYGIRGFAPPGARPWVGPLLLLVTAAFLASVSVQFLENEARDFLLPGCHAGVQSLAFLSAGLLARYCRDGRAWRLPALALIGLAACFSDRLFALYFPVPAFLTLAAARLVAPGANPRLTWRRILIPAFAVAIGCAAGLALLKKLPSPGVDADPIGAYWTGVEAAGLAGRAEQLARGAARQVRRGDALVTSTACWLAATGLLLAGLAIRRVLGRGEPRSAPGVADYAAYSWVGFVVVTAVFLVSATGASCLEPVCVDWGIFDRYFVGPQAMALFGWALLLARLAARGGVARVVALALPAALATYLLTLTFLEPRRDDRPLITHYPDYIRALDEVCTRRGLTNGFSGYWLAKEASYYSRTGCRVREVARITDGGKSRFVPRVWLSNAEWLIPRDDDGPYQFFLAHAVLPEVGGITAAQVREAFGPAAEEIQVRNVVIMVYDRPSDDKFRNLLNVTPELGRLEYRINPRGKTHFIGASFFPGSCGEVKGSARVAGPGGPAGCMAFGPYLVPRLSGWHYAEFRLRAEGQGGPPGAVDVYLYDDAAKKDVVLVPPTGVPAGYDQTMRLEFFVPPELVGRPTAALQFRTFYTGNGKLTLEYVDFGRFRK